MAGNDLHVYRILNRLTDPSYILFKAMWKHDWLIECEGMPKEAV